MPQHSLVGVPSLECLATGSTANFRTSHCRFYIGQQTFTGGAGEANEIDPFGLSGVVKVLLAAIFHESSVSVCMPCWRRPEESLQRDPPHRRCCVEAALEAVTQALISFRFCCFQSSKNLYCNKASN